MPKPTPTPANPREALKQSEKAARAHPEHFKENVTEEKLVEIDPIHGGDAAAIKGIDPKRKERPGGR